MHPMPNSLISVIVPSFNQGQFIRETIESCLAQDYRPIEVVVIDGASTDGTLDVLHSYDGVPEVRWLSERDSGPVEAVNKGFAMARGGIGLIQSADDVSTPGAFSVAVQAFADSAVGLAYGDVDRIAADGSLAEHVDVGRYSLTGLLARQTWVPQPCAFFRLEAARRLGGWDARFPYCPDTDLWFRLALSSKVVRLPRVLGQIRAHPGQRDHRAQEVYSSYERMVREDEVLAGASLRCRLAARAGLSLLALRYGAGFTDWDICTAAWKAVVLYPPTLLSPSIPRHRLIPGYFRLAGVVGRLRRLLAPCNAPAKG